MKGYFLITCAMLSLFWCSGHTLECFRCDLGFWNLCYTTKTNCSDDEMCYVGIGKAAGVLDIKVMGCLVTEECNRTTVVEFLSNKSLYSMKKSCCDDDFCNAGSALQFSLASLSLTVLIIAQMIGLF
ncbi:sperm acrosome membrane-associated protein 4-like [Triplophysa rosa]|uniref:Sperm acrosome membrane-associated protein 4-like n=1 Tax=Triplophysa rosa TaxID=992332 RepID=A0A9W8C3W9_TRIRA|nr:sperm acrosome membrane-associated protein 4-like [Triplophysa rosa]KAI7806772.1 putative sperm acrosome membrane-associated protein 4-like [Triplophysa rosa]